MLGFTWQDSFKTMVLLLLMIRCCLLLPLWDSVIVCCALLYAHSSFAIILMGKRELVALLCLSSWCRVIVARLFLTMQRVCLQFVSVTFPDHTLTIFDIMVNSNASVKLLFVIPVLLNKTSTDRIG